MDKKNIRIEILTDEKIVELTKNNVLTEHRDINLKVEKLDPYEKGVYDPTIFGALQVNRCNCGNIRTPGIRCPRCGTNVLSQEESFKRFGRIESPVYYYNKYKITNFISLIKTNFKKIVTDFESKYFEGKRWYDQAVLDVCQFEYDKSSDTLTVTDKIDDFTKCSFEGLISLIHLNKPDILEEARAYLNQYIIVLPIAMRRPMLRIRDGKRVLENDKITGVYKNIIYCIHQFYKTTFPKINSELVKAYFRGSLRALISRDLESISEIMRPSDENMARTIISNRVPNSGRAVIVPDPTLKADEVVIPRHLMYETCMDEFVQYIADKKGTTTKKAEEIYKNEYDDPETQRLFEEYIAGDDDLEAKYVIINRAPTLYELSMAVCKVKLTNDYVMKIPQALCPPLNADFDGDAMTYYSIPKKMNELMTSAMSPKNIFLYKKNHKPLYVPTHEMMHGLIQASKVYVPDKLETFDSLQDLKDYKKMNRDFKYQTMVILNGQKTTLGREILSELFDKDVNAYLEDDFKGNINSDNCIFLYEQLRGKPDRLERIRDISEFALKVTTLSGSTAPRISELYVHIDKKYLDEIRAIESNEKLDQKTKDSTIRTIYEEFQKKVLKEIPDHIKTGVTETSRAKLPQLRDMSVQQLNVGPDGVFHLSETTLVGCMSPLDYKNHAIENRAVQDIKQLSVPMSGYVTRQFNYLASEYLLIDGEDEKNEGIYLKESEAEGRTRVNGTVVGKSKSDEPVKVRSILTSTLGPNKITLDMLSNVVNYPKGSKVGMSMISSLTETLTQSGLALKHSGNLFQFPGSGDKYPEWILSPDSGKLKIEDGWVILTTKTGKEYKWPEGNRFAQSLPRNGDTYDKGDVLGRHYLMVTPSYRLDRIIKLCSANPVSGNKTFQNNKKILSDCYSRNSGVLRYIKDEDNKFKVMIGDEEYRYDPENMYYVPDGTEVKKYQRICSGTLDLKNLTNKEKDYIEVYKYFKIQFDELLPVSPELIEFLFSLLVRRGEDKVQVQSLVKSVKGSSSFFKSLAFGYAGRTLKEITYEGKDIGSDPITSVILPLILSNKI